MKHQMKRSSRLLTLQPLLAIKDTSSGRLYSRTGAILIQTSKVQHRERCRYFTISWKQPIAPDTVRPHLEWTTMGTDPLLPHHLWP